MGSVRNRLPSCSLSRALSFAAEILQNGSETTKNDRFLVPLRSSSPTAVALLSSRGRRRPARLSPFVGLSGSFLAQKRPATPSSSLYECSAGKIERFRAEIGSGEPPEGLVRTRRPGAPLTLLSLFPFVMVGNDRRDPPRNRCDRPLFPLCLGPKSGSFCAWRPSSCMVFHARLTCGLLCGQFCPRKGRFSCHRRPETPARRHRNVSSSSGKPCLKKTERGHENVSLAHQCAQFFMLFQMMCNSSEPSYVLGSFFCR